MPTELPPSIFNDVVGPVMRGPSSSHSAASVRIGRLARDLSGGQPDSVLIEFDTEGSLATTHASQGSDMGLFGGLLGWEADDARLAQSRAALEAAGVRVEMRNVLLRDPHPNTYRLTLRRNDVVHRLVALSTGGGMIEVIEIDGTPVSLYGDYDVTLCDVDAGAEQAVGEALRPCAEVVHLSPGPLSSAGSAPGQLSAQRTSLAAACGHGFVDGAVLDRLSGVRRVRRLNAVLPVRSSRDMTVPFLHASELEDHGDVERQPLSDFALAYEGARGRLDAASVLGQMRRVHGVIEGAIAEGLAGTESSDRVLPRQSHRFRARLEAGELLDGGLLNRAILYVTALMEVKSAMGVFVAAPTAGSCGTFPGTMQAAAESLKSDEDSTLKALLAGGLIGVFVSTRSSFAAEVGGCQAETGAGAAMAAAALVELMGGSAAQSLSAASHAIQNVLGLVCDPVANRVEAPCLGRNVAGAANAIACANMALAGYDHLIPLDEVLDAHRAVSKSMPRELRCTALGGLSVTPTSKAIEARLNARVGAGCAGCGQV